MYARKEDKNIIIMVVIIFVVSIVALIAIGNIIWKIISPGVALATTEISRLIAINRLDYNFPIPAKRESVSALPTPIEFTAEQQVVLARDLDYDFEIPNADNNRIVVGVTNFYEEIYTDSDFGPDRITEESNKNMIITINKLAINSPAYITPESSLALKFGFWMHSSSYKLNEGEMVFLCTRRYFDNNDPRSCYFMNYMSVNDTFSIEYNKEKFNYKVNAINYIKQDYQQIYENISSDKNSLKMVTTGALDSGRGRLVITANRI